MSDDKSKSPPAQPPPWKSEEWVAFFKAIEPYADKLLQYMRERGEEEHRLQRLGGSHDWRIATVEFLFLGVLVALMSWLTSISRVSGDALLFLAGPLRVTSSA
ncbi:MAG TPA: hypothetical protein VFE98_09245 [Candidatus Bathyarchaeia archaeon]|nr:hypothetical protein [Candidatus Bathyarchaeia archaeon]